ncbi:hypothetical protein M408DRAFT_332723 [Serendipita vermifera MAFF 305830]|uniref:FAM86 N-terminal domain-containing protein n=1 Tax=Serendipita vermifera MAFF 305830 TaxID=933852 RepID=A0A0C2WZY8_SERVB|nr:hypothetical protein M408DRAFT_332723 [Serendipita vermifera MAFF 305830]
MQNLKILRDFGRLEIFREASQYLDQEFLIKAILEDHDHFRNYPPAATFERSFWKWVIDTVETRGEEVDERIYHRYITLLAKPRVPEAQMAPSSSYTTYFIEPPLESKSLLENLIRSPFAREWPGVLSITMLESRKTLEQGTTGLRTWQPGLIFADWLLRNPSIAKGRVLELGCGAGLTAIITALIQKALSDQGETDLSLCLTDFNENVINACKRNVNLQVNQLSERSEICWRMLDWNDALPGAADRESLLTILREFNPTVVFGTDLVYDTTIIPALAYTLSILAFELPNSPDIILAVTLRRMATIETFFEELGKLGLSASMHDLLSLEDTVFAKRNDVDKTAIVKLVRVFRTER